MASHHNCIYQRHCLHPNHYGNNSKKTNFPPPCCKSENNILFRKPKHYAVPPDWMFSIHKDMPRMFEVGMSVPASLYKSLTDTKKGLLRSIMKDCGKIQICFPRSKTGLTIVVIRGPINNVDKAKEKLQQLAEEEKSKNYTACFPIKSQYHKFLMNKNGKLQNICEKSGAHVVFPSPKSKDQESITIIGKEDAVKEVQKELEAFLKDLGNEIEDSLLINRKFHHYFVMRRDQLLREMSDIYCGVIINFSYEGKESIRVTMKGEKPFVVAAKRHIQEIFEPLGSHITTQYVISQQYHPFILGPMCSRIQQIARDYKVQIKFPAREKSTLSLNLAFQDTSKEKRGKINTNHTYSAPRKSKRLFISGQAENCKAAMEALESLIPVTAEVHVPIHLHSYIIGYKGNGIKKLMNEFEVHIQAPQTGENSDVISIMGLPASVEQAKIRLQKQVNALQTKIEDRELKNFKLTFAIDPKFRFKIFGHKGLLIAQICKEYDVTIHFPKRGSSDIQDQITITGYKDNTQAARDAMLKMLHRIDKKISKEITLNNEVLANIIGLSGKAIHKIMEQFQVDIRLPPKGSLNSNITVCGLSDNVQEAIDHILKLEKHYLSAAMRCESQLEHFKNSCLWNITLRTPNKSLVRKDIPRIEKAPRSIPEMNNSGDVAKLKPQKSQKTHPWRP